MFYQPSRKVRREGWDEEKRLRGSSRYDLCTRRCREGMYNEHRVYWVKAIRTRLEGEGAR